MCAAEAAPPPPPPLPPPTVVATPTGGGSSFWLPPSAKTSSTEAKPPFDEVGVPPLVIATYSLPPVAKIAAPAAIWWPVWKCQRIVPVLVSKARSTPSPPPTKPSPLAVVVTPPRSGSGVANFHATWPVATSIASTLP